MLLIDVFLSRYDDLVDILRGSELKSQLDSTEFQVRLWVPKTLVVNPKKPPATLIWSLTRPASRRPVPYVTLMRPGSAIGYGQV
jgi:hypothetical protein